MWRVDTELRELEAHFERQHYFFSSSHPSTALFFLSFLSLQPLDTIQTN